MSRAGFPCPFTLAVNRLLTVYLPIRGGHLSDVHRTAGSERSEGAGGKGLYKSSLPLRGLSQELVKGRFFAFLSLKKGTNTILYYVT